MILKKGFTLIELLVVFGIISLLASTVLVSVVLARDKARIARQQVEVHDASTSIAAHKNDGTLTYILPPNTDSYFTVDIGSYALSNVYDGDGYLTTIIAPLRKSEVLTMPDPNGASSASYYYYSGGWRKAGSALSENYDSLILTKYFIIRNSMSSTENMLIILPSNVTYYGTSVQNGMPRPW